MSVEYRGLELGKIGGGSPRRFRCFGGRGTSGDNGQAPSFMINAGIDLYAVGKVLGHARHKNTMRYSHLANETLLAAVEAGAANMRL